MKDNGIVFELAAISPHAGVIESVLVRLRELLALQVCPVSTIPPTLKFIQIAKSVAAVMDVSGRGAAFTPVSLKASRCLLWTRLWLQAFTSPSMQLPVSVPRLTFVRQARLKVQVFAVTVAILLFRGSQASER